MQEKSLWNKRFAFQANVRGFFFRRDVSVICLIILLKLAVTVFTSLYFRMLWPNWKFFFDHFKRKFGLWRKMTDKINPKTNLSSLLPALWCLYSLQNLTAVVSTFIYLKTCFSKSGMKTAKALPVATLMSFSSSLYSRFIVNRHWSLLRGPAWIDDIVRCTQINSSRSESTYTVLVLTEKAAPSESSEHNEWHPVSLLRKTLFRPESTASQVRTERRDWLQPLNWNAYTDHSHIVYSTRTRSLIAVFNILWPVWRFSIVSTRNVDLLKIFALRKTVGSKCDKPLIWCFPNVMSRATKSQQSQNFSAVLKVHETSTNQISRSYHEGIPSY